MKLSFRRVVSVLLLLAAATCALADDPDLSNYSGGWLNLGVGLAGGNNFSGVGADVSLNYAPSNSRLWTLRSSEAVNLSGIFSNLFCTSNCKNEDSAGDVALMYGLMQKNTLGYVSASTGLALATDQQPEIIVNGVQTQPGSNTYTIGLPLELQAFITPVRYVGIGLIGFGDLNTRKSFGGVALALQFGKLA